MHERARVVRVTPTVFRYWRQVATTASGDAWRTVKTRLGLFPIAAAILTLLLMWWLQGPAPAKQLGISSVVGFAGWLVIYSVRFSWRLIAIPAFQVTHDLSVPLRLVFDPTDIQCREPIAPSSSDRTVVEENLFRLGVSNAGHTRAEGVRVVIAGTDPVLRPLPLGRRLPSWPDGLEEFSVQHRQDGRPTQYVSLAKTLVLLQEQKVWTRFYIGHWRSDNGCDQGILLDNTPRLILSLRLEHPSGCVDCQVLLELRDKSCKVELLCPV